MTLPSFAPAATAPVSRCLLSWSAKDRSLRCRSGQTLVFTRASIGALMGSNGRVGFAGQYQPRFSMAEGATAGVFDEIGILLENAATNLWLRSAAFDNATWVKAGLGTVTANVQLSPDSITGAEKLPETSANSEHKVAQAVTITAGNYVALSVWARASERDRLFLHAFNGADHLQARFDLTAKTATNTSTGAATFRRAWVETWADGWLRCCLVGRVNAGSTAITGEVQVCATTVASYTGTTGSGIHVWGAQFEQGNSTGAKPSSYIATTTATASRSRDALSTSFLWPFGTGLTVYTRFIRPRWGGLTTFDFNAALFTLSSGQPRAFQFFFQLDGNLYAEIENATPTVEAVNNALPATTVIEACAQFDSLGSAGRVRQDVGSGFGGFSNQLPIGFTAWGDANFQIGDLFGSTGACLGSEITDIKVQLGARTLANMAAEY